MDFIMFCCGSAVTGEMDWQLVAYLVGGLVMLVIVTMNCFFSGDDTVLDPNARKGPPPRDFKVAGA